MKRFLIAACVGLVFVAHLFSAQAESSASEVTFHFYGAKNCPPCMAFKRDGLPIVQKTAAQTGFSIAVNIAERTRDVMKPGTFGARDGLLRAAGKQIGSAYPPVFFITRKGRITSVHAHDWRAALAQAKKDAAAKPS